MCMQSFFASRENLSCEAKRSEKTNNANRKIPGGYFGRNVVIYVRMRTK